MGKLESDLRYEGLALYPGRIQCDSQLILNAQAVDDFLPQILAIFEQNKFSFHVEYHRF